MNVLVLGDSVPDGARTGAPGGAVETHLPVARPIEAWHDRTVDGVPPDDAGHAHVADRVADWLRSA